MKQFRTIDTKPAICKDPIITREMIFAAFTPLVIAALVVFLGATMFVYFTQNPPAPASNAAPGPGNVGAYGDSHYYAYNDIFNEASYRWLTTSKPTALGYSLYISCVEYKSQLACNEFDLLQQPEEMERR